VRLARAEGPAEASGGLPLTVTDTEDALVAGHAAPDPESFDVRAPADEAAVREEIETDLLTDLMEECP